MKKRWIYGISSLGAAGALVGTLFATSVLGAGPPPFTAKQGFTDTGAGGTLPPPSYSPPPLTSLPPVPTTVPGVASGTPPTPGITNGPSEGPFSSSVFANKNSYVGVVGSQTFVIWAGEAVNPDGSLGVGTIYVLQEASDISSAVPVKDSGPIAVPNSPSWVQVASGSGSTIVLQKADGTQIQYNASTSQFSSPSSTSPSSN